MNGYVKFGFKGALAAIILLIFGCIKEKESSTLQIAIHGTYGDKPLVFAPGSSYNYFDGSKITFTRSEFFLSRIELITQNNESIPVGAEYLCELQNHHISEARALEGFRISIPVSHTGKFKGIRFGIGLPAAINNKKPSDFTAENILSDGEHYWSGWNSYVFSKTEGELSNGSKSVLFAYHTGFNEAYVTKEILKPIELVQNQTGTVDVKFDHNKLFGTASDYTNIYENNIVHNGVEFMIRYMNQLKNSME